ncbi:uncharacterized protein N7482_009857 [Penicillium canariense]|uniref:Uncharacterized protein n=1 Tax=Penicillium canariense TaxID=189055 RepID=A0A9W9HR71_9EURO|nr:uncharacterized protein N7482_009857 [Penicillium canariense]KAJ5153379.1 hypothetical protein N7482_009857 [Penicillium canariense]
MLSHNYPSFARSAPPVRPSRSLDGLERVIPPTPTLPYTTRDMAYSSTKLCQPFSPTRSDLFLNKPLPARPVPDAPAEYSVMWSDSSDSESTVDSVGSPSEPRNSTESYPIFVSSGSEDFSDLVDHPTPADPDHLRLESLGPIHPSPPAAKDSRTDVVESAEDDETDDSDFASHSTTSKSDAQYGRLSQWSQNRSGSNHYFREKKWDFFPELATPSALQTGSRTSRSLRDPKPRKKDGRLNISKRRRWHSLDRPGLGLAHGVRDSIKTYVHRTLSRDSTEAKAKEFPRPSTAPGDELQKPFPFNHPEDTKIPLHSDVQVQLRSRSISTVSTTSDIPSSPRSVQPRPKQLAVPMSNYQKYGPAIWDTPKKPNYSTMRRPKHLAPRSAPASPSSAHFPIANPTPPLTPPLKLHLQNRSRDAVRVIQGRKSHVLLALDGAKKKMAESKDERRREQLKAQIKLIGPVNPHTYMQADPWV